MLDEVLTFAFRSPHSYTREDLVEIQAHGGPVILQRLLSAILAAGASLAEPGEFTERAVRNGRLNLYQAEAVLDLIRAKTNAAAEAAMRRLAEDGGRRLSRVEAEILGLLAEVEAWLDFPDDVPEPEISTAAARAGAALSEFDVFLTGAERGRLLREGAAIVIVGRPNVGKSSLLNALLGEERAIVTDIPGTTRDAVAEEIDLHGMPVRLVDTAGLGWAADELEARGMDRSRRELARADLSLLVLDGSAPLTPEDEAVAAEAAGQGRGVVAVNKSDLPTVMAGRAEAVAAWPHVHVSAKTGQGLDRLRDVLAGELGGRQAEAAPLLSQARQIEAAREARAALAGFLDGIKQGLAFDFLAEDLRACLRALGRLTGRELGPEVLKEIFSRFCLGK